MNIADELNKLQKLHREGALSDEEFAQAKAAVLKGTPAPRPEQTLAPRLRTMKIIACALLLGVVSFLAVVLFLVFQQNNGQGLAPPSGVPVISAIAVTMFAGCAPLAFVVPRLVTQMALQRIGAGTWQPPPEADAKDYATDSAKLLAVWQVSTIIGLALLEGSAFMGCIAYLMEAQVVALGVIAVAVALMLVKFPTEDRLRTWLERQGELLLELRRQADFHRER